MSWRPISYHTAEIWNVSIFSHTLTNNVTLILFLPDFLNNVLIPTINSNNFSSGQFHRILKESMVSFKWAISLDFQLLNNVTIILKIE